MSLISIRDFLSNRTKYRGIAKIDPRKIEAILALSVSPDGTLEPLTTHPQVEPTSTLSAVSAATTVYTCPAGKYWLCLSAMMINANRATTIRVDVNDLAYKRNPTSSNNVWTGVDLDRIRINAGSTVIINDEAFVAADVVNRVLVYEEYDL